VHGVETILFLAVLGTVVAAFAGWLRVPASSLLVIAGPAVGLLPGFRPAHAPADQDAGRGWRGKLIRVRVLAVCTVSERVLMS
jgi:hypothetical protein